ncbi:MAG: beta-lactamase family protein [Bacteroidetes bacterium]|nr:beta-lactamase family protein [Bacteroidota bacterium]
MLVKQQGVLFFIFICSIGTYAQKTKTEKIDSLLKKLYYSNQFNGAVLIREKEKVIYKKGYGWADYNKKDTIDSNTRFHIASISKPFTAIAIMLLRDEGKLVLSDDITKYLPELTHYKGITIRHLLQHTSGINYPENLKGNREFKLFEKKYLDTIPKKDQPYYQTNEFNLRYLATCKPKLFNTPGEKFMYSNIAYSLLPIIITRITHIKFETFMENNVFKPSGMHNTFIYNGRMDDTLTNFARPDMTKTCKGDDVNGSNMICASIEDMNMFDIALFSEKLIRLKTLQEMITTSVIDDKILNTKYGLGWELFSNKHDSLIYHMGNYLSYTTQYKHCAKNDYTILIFMNMEKGNTKLYVSRFIECLLKNDYKRLNALKLFNPPKYWFKKKKIPKKYRIDYN